MVRQYRGDGEKNHGTIAATGVKVSAEVKALNMSWAIKTDIKFTI